MTAFPCPDDGLAGLEPVLDALSDGITRALHVAVAAELRLWAAACRGMAVKASVHKPFTDPLPPFDGGRVAVYGAMAEWLERRANDLASAAAGVAEADEERAVAEFLELIRPSTGTENEQIPVPVTDAPGPVAIEVVSYLASLVDMSPGQEEDLRVALQRMIDEGRAIVSVWAGEVVTTTVPATASWVPGDPVHLREPERGRCSNATCGTAWMPADVEACPECGIPVKKPVYNWTKAANPVTAREVSAEEFDRDADLAATEVASYLAFQGGLTPAVQEGLRIAFRRMVGEGRVVGRVLVGDHVEGGTTVPDWAEVGNP